VVLISGWAGEQVLVRLLAASGSVRIRGQVLADPVREPAAHLRGALEAAATDGRAGGVLVQAHHLWLRNRLDPDAFVADLIDDGIVVLSLHRSSHVDRGLSRALCGPRWEVLPFGVQVVDAGAVAVFAKEDEYAAEWFPRVVPDAGLRLVFEDDLLTAGARARALGRLARSLDLDLDAPGPARHPDPAVPAHDELWRRVADPDRLRADLSALPLEDPCA
jgi:hypothetical protein